MVNSNTTGSNNQHNTNTDCCSGSSSGSNSTNSSSRSRMNRPRNDIDADTNTNTNTNANTNAISSDSDCRFDPYPRHHNSAPRSVLNRSRNNNNSNNNGIGTSTGTCTTNNNDTNSNDSDRRSNSDSYFPRSLSRDCPLAEPSSYRYPYNPLVAMNGNGLGGGLQHSTTTSSANISAATRNTATPSANTTTATKIPSISATTTKIRSHSPENDSVDSGSRYSPTSSYILPKIDESCRSSNDSTTSSDTSCNDEYIFRRNKKQGDYFHKTINNDNSSSSTSLTDMPHMSVISDNSSIDSWQHSSSTLYDLLDNDHDADCCPDNFCDNHVTTTPTTNNTTGERDTAHTSIASLESRFGSRSSHANSNNNTSWQRQQLQQQLQQHSSSLNPSTPSLSPLNNNSNRNNRQGGRNSLNTSSKQHQQHQQLQHHQRRLSIGASSSLPFLVSSPGQQQTQTVHVVQGSNNTIHRLSSAAPFTTSTSASATISNNPILTKTRSQRDGQNSISSNPFVLTSSSKKSSSIPRFRHNSSSSSAFSRKVKANPFKRPKTTAQQQQRSRQQPDHYDTVLMPNPKKCMVNFFYSAGVLLQLLVLLVIGTLVLWSRSQAAMSTEILVQLRHTESLELLKLHRLEDHSMHVHELIQKSLMRIHGGDSIDDLLHEDDASYEEAENEGIDNDSLFPSSSKNNNSKDGNAGDTTSDRDPHPLQAQYHQLREMSSQLRTHEVVLTLQDELQHTASEEIVANYGEGPLKVIIELNFNNYDDAAAAGNNNESDSNDDDRNSGENSNSDLNSSYDDLFNNNHKSSGTNTTPQKGNAMAQGTYLSVVLWPDAPHAAWAWLEQIQRNIWNGASLEWDPTSTLLQIRPTADDPADRGHLGFVERHMNMPEDDPGTHHGAWTIGLREVMSDDEQQQSGGVAAAASNKKNNIDGDDDDNTIGTSLRAMKHGSHSQITSSSSSTRKSRLEMFINLTDNQEKRKHETCVGKIFGGFDALQRLLEGTTLTDDGDAVTNVNVKTVTAMHMSHKELELVYR